MKDAKIPRSRAKTAYGLLNEVKRLILEEPKRYHQARFIARKGEEEVEGILNGITHFPACGTVGCVAGWVATLKGPKRFTYGQTESIASAILGLTEPAVVDELFSGAICDLSDLARPQTKRYAQLGARHISIFQKKYATQLKAKRI